MKIKNFKQLAKNDLRENILNIAEAGLKSIDIGTVISDSVSLNEENLFIKDKVFSLENKRLHIVGIGKSGFKSAKTLKRILGEKIYSGLVIDIEKGDLGNIKTYEATHPFPSNKNKEASKDLVSFLKKMDEDDFVIFVISGGGSTMLTLPDGISVKEEEKIIKELFKSGATIQEINTIRKHISFCRGGFLLQYVYPAKSVSLILSDVPGDDFQFISSGPTIKDNTTIEGAKAIISKYSILEKTGVENIKLIETPKDDRYFNSSDNLLILSNQKALDIMSLVAKRLGFSVFIKTNTLKGEAREIGIQIAQELKKHPPKTVLLYAGETTVTIKGNGLGGRNQELVLGAFPYIIEKEIIMSFASDGYDNSDHAGALCDYLTKEKAEEININFNKYLQNNDSYIFFEITGDYLETGNTGSNVSDLIIAAKA
ncbi:MAG: DUF4147 domain-containing protein [Candidatus Paceibacterota bacterium]